jgi:hypothetical protein
VNPVFGSQLDIEITLWRHVYSDKRMPKLDTQSVNCPEDQCGNYISSFVEVPGLSRHQPIGKVFLLKQISSISEQAICPIVI